MTLPDDQVQRALLRRGFALEYVTLAWNVAGIVVLAIAAVSARSVALAGFALDSLIEIGASTVVIWELSGTGEQRQRRGLRLIGYAFAALAAYLLVQSTVVLATGYQPRPATTGRRAPPRRHTAPPRRPAPPHHRPPAPGSTASRPPSMTGVTDLRTTASPSLMPECSNRVRWRPAQQLRTASSRDPHPDLHATSIPTAYRPHPPAAD